MLNRTLFILLSLIYASECNLSCQTDISSLPPNLPSFLFNNCSSVSSGKVECTKDKISFLLYNSSGIFEITLENISIINKHLPTIITVHGGASVNDNSSIFAIKNAYLSCTISNFILLDWRKCNAAAVFSYSSIVANTKFIGNLLADFINNLILLAEIPKKNIKIIGFSMGGQIVGFAGKMYKKNHHQTLEHIISIDPIGPGFRDCNSENRLSNSDAKCVEVLHTSELRGSLCPLGTVDYYINGGIVQQGCNETVIDDPKCSHEFGNYFLAEMICSKTNKCRRQFCPTEDICDKKVNPLQKIATKTACIQPGLMYVGTGFFGNSPLCNF